MITVLFDDVIAHVGESIYVTADSDLGRHRLVADLGNVILYLFDTDIGVFIGISGEILQYADYSFVFHNIPPVLSSKKSPS